MCLIPCNLCHSRHKYPLLQFQKFNSCSSRKKLNVIAFTLVHILLPYHLYAADYLTSVMIKKVCKWNTFTYTFVWIPICSICVTSGSDHGSPTAFHIEQRVLWARNLSSSSAAYNISAWGSDINISKLSGEKEVLSGGITGILQCWSWAGLNSVQPNENCILDTRLGQRPHLCLFIKFSLRQ